MKTLLPWKRTFSVFQAHIIGNVFTENFPYFQLFASKLRLSRFAATLVQSRLWTIIQKA